MLDLIAPPPTTPQMGDKPQKVKKLRSTRACISCRIRKIRCDAQERIPCLNCAPLGSTCKFVEPKSRKKKQRMIAPTPPTPPMQWPPGQGGYYGNPYTLMPQYYPYAAPTIPTQASSMSAMASMPRLSPMGQQALLLQQPLPYQSHHYGQVKITPQQMHSYGLPLNVQLPGYSQQSYGSQPYATQQHQHQHQQQQYATSNPSMPQGKVLPPPQAQTQLQQPFQAQPQQYGATQQLLAQSYSMPPPQQLLLAQSYAMPPPVAYFPPHPYYYGQVVQSTPPQPTPYLTPLDLRVVLLPQFPLYPSPLGHKSREGDKP